MPTNLALDDALIKEAVRLGKHKTKKEAVTAALREYLREGRRLRKAEESRATDSHPTGMPRKTHRAKISK